MIDVLERQLLTPERLEELLTGLLDKLDTANERRGAELIKAGKKEETRAKTAINRLLELTETGAMSARDPAFAERLVVNEAALTSASSRAANLERQLTTANRKITPQAIVPFGKLMRRPSAARSQAPDGLRAPFRREGVGQRH